MRIKRVEIIGFKSFCDRATINIDSSVTAVVGPNGCGKSNIVDAIRWCMGEQSAKHLRGKAMEDVIFAGSESRGPAPMAEVSLTFDDVGFSHETLELAMKSDEAEAERAAASIDAVGEDDGGAEQAVADDDGEGGGLTVAELALQAEAEEQALRAAEGALGVDAEGNPVASQAEAVRDFLGEDRPQVDFSRYTEVTITRRLFRDGTSHYLINKQPCRLRDVTDFFLGTGVGTKAYSIIEQGRIGQIVSSRPGDRRAIIEEAAGITKFKAKKKAAEKKLDQTRQNLLRVSDIVEELDRRMGTLRRQAQKAERFRKYRAEQRDLELWKASHRLLELAAEASMVGGRLTEASAELDSGRTDLLTKDAAAVAERAELSLEERRLASIQEELYELDNQLQLAQSKVDFQRREANDLTQRAQAATAEIETLHVQRDQALAEAAAGQAELAELGAAATAERDGVGAHEARASEARAMLERAQRDLDSIRGQIAGARTDLATATAQLEALARRRDEAARRLAQVSVDTAAAADRAGTAERDLRNAETELANVRQTRLDLGGEVESFVERAIGLRQAVATGEAQVETLRTEVHRRRSRMQSLIEIQDRYEGFARGTRAVMQQAPALAAQVGHGQIRGLVADVVRAPETLEVAVEVALGERLGGVLVDSPELGVAAIGYLKSSSGGRSTFVPMPPEAAPRAAISVVEAVDGSAEHSDRVGAPMWGDAAAIAAVDAAPAALAVEDRSDLAAAVAAHGEQVLDGVLGKLSDLVEFTGGFAPVGRALVGGVTVVRDLPRAVALHAQGVGGTLVTLEGDVVDAAGVVTGGSREAQGAGVLAQKREIRELEEIVGGLEHELADATHRLLSARTDLTQTERAIDGLKSQAHAGDLAIIGLDKDVVRLRGELERARERLGQLGNEQLELEERLAVIASDETAAAERRDRAQQVAAEREQLQLERIEEVAGGRERLDELAAALTEARVRAAQAGEKQASLAAQVMRLEQSARELSGRIERLGSDAASATERAASLVASSDALALEASAARERRIERAAALETGRVGYTERLSALTALELDVRDLRSRADRLTTEVGQLELRAQTVALTRGVLVDGIFERYQLDLTEIVSDYHQRAVAGQAEDDRLTELRDLLDRMGTDINLTAIDEFAEVSQRFEFLSAQRADLESAVEQLQHAIDKINKTSRRLFKETFDAVNATFKQVFPRLFRGGQARLSLVMPSGAAVPEGEIAEGSEGSGGRELDLLEAGIEIVAQPPGKKNSTVEQLSGGEKALTAVALIFSIFLNKPSPFCILDEVDAPLDEANVDRYNEIVRQMTDRSQFIVITHNKRTMESADNLYGVTMQDPGVSKLVTVNLSRLGRGGATAAA